VLSLEYRSCVDYVSCFQGLVVVVVVVVVVVGVVVVVVGLVQAEDRHRRQPLAHSSLLSCYEE